MRTPSSCGKWGVRNTSRRIAASPARSLMRHEIGRWTLAKFREFLKDLNAHLDHLDDMAKMESLLRGEEKKPDASS